jgi:hypothetical protein
MCTLDTPYSDGTTLSKYHARKMYTMMSMMRSTMMDPSAGSARISSVGSLGMRTGASAKLDHTTPNLWIAVMHQHDAVAYVFNGEHASRGKQSMEACKVNGRLTVLTNCCRFNEYRKCP